MISDTKVKPVMNVLLLLLFGWIVQAHISSFQNGKDVTRTSTERAGRGFTLGKDTELFHASVDLNWLTRTLADKRTWVNLYLSILHRLKLLDGTYNNECTYQMVATDLTSEFREVNPSSPLRPFQCSLAKAHRLSTEKQRLIVFYIEKESRDASRRTIKARVALSDFNLGKLLNDQFLFMASVDSHPYASEVLRCIADYRAQQELLGQLVYLDNRRPLIQNEGAARTLLNNELASSIPQLPVLAVLSPVPQISTLWNIPLPPFLRRRVQFEVVGLLPLHAVDASAQDTMMYLRRVVKGRVLSIIPRTVAPDGTATARSDADTPQGGS